MPKDLTPLFLCSWGDIQLFAQTIEWEDGETNVVHNLAAGDDHPIQPRGSQIKTATLQLLFDEFDGAPETGFEAFRRFKATIKERRIFTHPMLGSYFARIGSFKPQLDENSVPRATCEVVPDGFVQSVSPAGAGTPGAGELSVAAAADQLAQDSADIGTGFAPARIQKLDFGLSIDASVTAAFSADISLNASANLSASATASASISASVAASVSIQATASAFAFATVYADALATANAGAVGIASGMPSPAAFAFALASAALDRDARTAVASWVDEDETPAGKVMIDCARLSESIATMIEVGDLEKDLALWPLYRSAIMLGDAIRGAALAATSEAPRVFVMRLDHRTSLLPLCAKIYGGLDAQSKARQILGLNDIRTPGWLDPGDYLMPARPVVAGDPLGAV